MLAVLVLAGAACGRVGHAVSSPESAQISTETTIPAWQLPGGGLHTIPTPGGGLPPPEPPRNGIDDLPTGAVALQPSGADIAGIVAAYETFTGYSLCRIRPVPLSLKVARVIASGIRWAFGRFQPLAGCTIDVHGRRIDALREAPFAMFGGAAGVFEKDPGKQWVMNWFESVPFPCPDDPSDTRYAPGPGRPYLPLAVLRAVGVQIARGCSRISIPSAPRS